MLYNPQNVLHGTNGMYLLCVQMFSSLHNNLSNFLIIRTTTRHNPAGKTSPIQRRRPRMADKQRRCPSNAAPATTPSRPATAGGKCHLLCKKSIYCWNSCSHEHIGLCYTVGSRCGVACWGEIIQEKLLWCLQEDKLKRVFITLRFLRF